METNLEQHDVEALGDVVYDSQDFAAAISSGSFLVDGIAFIPCSIKTLASVATGVSTDLIARDVVTELDITGKPAQFGRGVMVDVGNKLIGQFADCLAGKLIAAAA